MEKEMNEKKKQKEKTKSITKKAKKMRSIVMMSLLCVLMLSAATYAWFTLSKTAKVANLTMTVGEATGLQIAPDAGANGGHTPGTYSGVLTFGDDGTTFGTDGKYKITGKLLPATTTDGKDINKPKYNTDGEVMGVEDIDAADILTNTTTNTAEEGYYYETTFYLKTLGSTATNVVLKASTTALPSDGKVTATYSNTGTYVLSNDINGAKNTTNYLGSRAIRISLTDAAGTTLVYEPNCNVVGIEGTQAAYATDENGNKVSMTAVTTTSAQSSSGGWMTSSDSGWVEGKQTKYLNVKTDDTLITMRIWIEGTDNECVNEISLDDIIAQLQFEEATAKNCSAINPTN